MDAVTVLVTGGGAPGIAGTIHSLRSNWDHRAIRIVCVDMQDDVVGRYLADACYAVPSARDPQFIDRLAEVCAREGVKVLIPQVTAELPILAVHRNHFARQDVRIAVSEPEALTRANDKYELADHARSLGVAVPKTTLVTTFAELEQAARALGFPQRAFAVKQPSGNGMRGFRAVFASLDRKRMFYEQKPDSSNTTIEELHAVLGDEFPALMVMEHLPGLEYTVDLLADEQRVHVVVPRERNQIRSGITFQGTTVAHAGIMRDSEALARSLRLSYAFGFQFKTDADGTPKLLECNPRVQGTMVMASCAGANVIYGAVKLALGEPVPAFDVRWGMKFKRYWGGVAEHQGEVVRI